MLVGEIRKEQLNGVAPHSILQGLSDPTINGTGEALEESHEGSQTLPSEESVELEEKNLPEIKLQDLTIAPSASQFPPATDLISTEGIISNEGRKDETNKGDNSDDKEVLDSLDTVPNEQLKELVRQRGNSLLEEWIDQDQEIDDKKVNLLGNIFEISPDQVRGVIDFIHTNNSVDNPVLESRVEEIIKITSHLPVKQLVSEMILGGYKYTDIAYRLSKIESQNQDPEHYTTEAIKILAEVFDERLGGNYTKIDSGLGEQVLRHLFEYAHKYNLGGDTENTYRYLTDAAGELFTNIDTFFEEQTRYGYPTYVPKKIGDEQIQAVITKGNPTTIFAYLYNFTHKSRYLLNEEEYETNIGLANRDRVNTLRLFDALSDPMLREFATLRIIKYNLDEDLGDLSVAERFIDQINSPELKLQTQVLLTKEKERIAKGLPKYEEALERVGVRSAGDLEALIEMYGFDTPQKRKVLAKETNKVKKTQKISINCSYKSILSVLRESKRFKSMYEKGGSRIIRRNGMRVECERAMGIETTGTIKDPHPIYGAVYSFNGNDEIYGAGGSRYGNTFVLLKNDRVKDRTIFGWGDAASTYMFTWDDAATAKALHNMQQGGAEFIEARILGGVSFDDIESINLPESVLQKEETAQEVGELRAEFPMMRFNFIRGR